MAIKFSDISPKTTSTPTNRSRHIYYQNFNDMKKKLLLFAACLFAFSGSMMAQNDVEPSVGSIYYKVQKTDIMQSKSATITFYYSAASDAIFKGFQVEFILPEGFHQAFLEEDSEGNPISGTIGADLKAHNKKLKLESSERYDNGPDQQPTNVYMGVQIDTQEFPTGEDIELFSCWISCDEDVAPGEYPFSTTHCELADMKTGQSLHMPEPLTMTLNVIPYTARILADDATTVPEASTKPEDVIVKRTVKKDVWSTLTLPFAVSSKDLTNIFGEGVKVGEFSEFDEPEDNENKQWVMKFETVDITKGLEANHPYIIKSENALTEFKVPDVEVNADEAAAVVLYDNGRTPGTSKYQLFGKMVGTLKGATAVPANNFILRDNKFYVSTGSTTINAFRAYFDIEDYEFGATAANITFVIDGEATDIEGININGKEIVTGDVYSVNGTYMGKAENVMNKLPRGIYIINNKKVVVK